MNRFFIHITVLSVVFLVVLGGLGLKAISYAQDSSGAVDQEVVEEKKERKDEIKNQKTELQKELDQKLKEKRNIVNDLFKTDKELNYTQSTLRDKEKELDRKSKQKAIIEGKLETAEADLSITQDNFEKRLRVFYKNGARSLLSVIVDAQDLSDLVCRLRYTENLLSYDENSIASIIEQKALLAEMHEDLNEGVSEYRQLVRDIDSKRSKYQQLHNQKVSIRNEISQDIRSTESLLAEMIREETEIEFFLEAAAKGNLSTNFDGTFSSPLNASYRISSGFGMRTHPVYRRRKMHNGMDLACPKGTPILAAGAGRVIFCGWKNGYGNTVMIDHGKGFATLYGHMSMILAKNNQDVMEGQPIGKVGSTGVTTGDHLHFEIRTNGKPRNPTEFLGF